MRISALFLVLLLAACGGSDSTPDGGDPDPVCTPSCEGRSCGDDGCEGSCGSCEAGFVCGASFVCEPSTCVPDCAGRACGDDGCGGTCGSCEAGESCDEAAGSCVAGGPTLSGDVMPIFAARCALACHAGRSPAEGLDLSTAADAWADLVDRTSRCDGRTLVVPGNADESYLVAKLTGVDICGTRMPQGTAALSAEQIDVIRTWIDAGAAND